MNTQIVEKNYKLVADIPTPDNKDIRSLRFEIETTSDPRIIREAKIKIRPKKELVEFLISINDKSYRNKRLLIFPQKITLSYSTEYLCKIILDNSLYLGRRVIAQETVV